MQGKIWKIPTDFGRYLSRISDYDVIQCWFERIFIIDVESTFDVNSIIEILHSTRCLYVGCFRIKIWNMEYDIELKKTYCQWYHAVWDSQTVPYISVLQTPDMSNALVSWNRIRNRLLIYSFKNAFGIYKMCPIVVTCFPLIQLLITI